MGSMSNSLMGMIFIAPMNCWMNVAANLFNLINSKSCLKPTLSTKVIGIKTLSSQTYDWHTFYLPTIARPHVHDNGSPIHPYCSL